MIKRVGILAFTVVSILAHFTLSAYGQTDGPATLPQRRPPVTLLTPNAPKTVAVTDNLQAIIATAVCGDVFLLDPALVYSGALAIPSLTCVDGTGISIRSAATVLEDSKHRVLVAQQFPRIILKGTQTVSTGAPTLFYGVEITRGTGTGTIYNLITLGAGAHDVIFDHVYVHGTPVDETVRGLMLGGGTRNVSVVNSYFSDFHCRAMGTCGDAQAILGGIGDAVDSGSYLISNNYLEGAGENVMFGGGGDAYTPCDITITGNDFNKPNDWNPGDPSYKGQRWIVKNLLEFKNACRVLVEGNRMIGSWGGFTQLGYGILVGAKNQNGGAPVATVTDITIRNNYISRTGLAMSVMLAPSIPNYWAKDEGRISIHDNVFDQLQYAECYQCGQWLIELSSGGGAVAPLHDILITNNTLFVPSWLSLNSGFMNIGGSLTAKMVNVNVTGNVFSAQAKYPVYSTGGKDNCAYGTITDYIGIFTRCGVSFTGNTVMTNGNTAKIQWPVGNTIVSTGANVINVQSAVVAAQ